MDLTFVMNEVFLGAALAVIGFALLSFLNRMKSSRPDKPNGWQVTMDYFLPIMTFALLYFTFFAEISAHWTQQYNASFAGTTEGDWLDTWMGYSDKIFNRDLLKFQTISIMDYTLVYLGALGVLNWLVWKNKNFGVILTAVSMFGILIYAIVGTLMFNDLSVSLNGGNDWNRYYRL